MTANEAAAEILGLPYEPFGRGPGAYDCLGAVLHVLHAIGLDLPDIAGPVRMEELDFSGWVERIDKPGPLDLLALPRENHVALVLDREFALHAVRDYGVCRARWKSWRRLPGVEFYRLKR